VITGELHDTELNNKKDGTLDAHIGTVHGSIEYEYQAEMWLDEGFARQPHSVRAYFLRGDGTPFAAWRRNPNKDPDTPFLCIGHVAGYGEGEGSPAPYVFKGRRDITVETGNRKTLTRTDGLIWAQRKLVGTVATAIVFDKQGIIAAWEPAQRRHDPPILVARGPSSFRDS